MASYRLRIPDNQAEPEQRGIEYEVASTRFCIQSSMSYTASLLTLALVGQCQNNGILILMTTTDLL
jgi:hypothetical protein